MAEGTREYMINRIKTASPIELVIIAYDAAINFLQKSRTALEQKEFRIANTLLVKAQKIIRELSRALDMDIEEISPNLFVLYRAMDKQLTDAVREKNVEPIDKVIEMLSGLRESWVEISGNMWSSSNSLTTNEVQYLSIYK